MFNILSNILFTGIALGIVIALAFFGVLLGVPAVSAFLILAGSLLSYLIVMKMKLIADNITAALPDEEEEPPHF